MDNGQTVWMVSSGSYSDYQVHCFCEFEAQARKIADDFGTEYHVEETTFYTNVEPIREYHYDVEILDDGTVHNERDWINCYWPGDEWNRSVPCKWRWYHATTFYTGPSLGRLQVRGTDLELVRKVYSDQKAMFMAEPARRMWLILDSEGTARPRDEPIHVWDEDELRHSFPGFASTATTGGPPPSGVIGKVFDAQPHYFTLGAESPPAGT